MEYPNSDSGNFSARPRHFSPRHQGFSPRHPGGFSPRHHGGFSPKHPNSSPNHYSSSPRRQGYSPRHQGSSPRHQHFSPRHQTPYWKQDMSNDFQTSMSSQLDSSNDTRNTEKHNKSHLSNFRRHSHHKKSFHGNQMDGFSSIEAYFSPCMLEDPWKKLEEKSSAKVNS